MSERPFETPPGTTILARDALAARQWEAFLARDAARAGARAWRTPNLFGYRTWLAEQWSARDAALPLLTAAQSRALWQRVIGESADGAGLIDVAAPAAWAAQAWGLLAQWNIDPRSLGAARDQPDFAAFLRWAAAYREALESNRWHDPAGLEAALDPPPAVERLVLADIDDGDLTPSGRALLERCVAAGAVLERWPVPASPAAAVRTCLPDEKGELDAALEWAGEQLDRRPERRIALVVADLDARRADLARLVPSLLGPSTRIWDPHGNAPYGDASIGAALTGIELLSPAATFTTLSRWLRSVPLDDSRSAAWARLEADLRRELLAQLRFRDAYRDAGLRARIQSAAPALAGALDAALAQSREHGDRQTPSGWAASWQRALRALGWPLTPPRPETRAAWEAALAELRRLTPVLGAIDEAHARGELERIVTELSGPTPQPTHGLCIFGRVEEVGPGFDGIWLTGCTNLNWPRPARLNPLLPRRLQQTHAMPWSSPHDALDRSRRALGALLERAPEVVVSWPAQALEQPAEPSPLIAALPDRPRRVQTPSAVEPRALERLEDRPPPLASTTIRGGAAALNAQARAPLRAFCEHRLGAKPIEPVGLGLSPRLRGIATHRALERLYTHEPAGGAAAGDERLVTAAAAALNETFGAARRGLGALFRLEHERLVEMLEAFRDVEAARAPFTVAAVERREEIAVGPYTLRARIDRVDRLADGGLAVLDYKTGPASANDWLRDRLRDVQVPLYAVHLGREIAAAVLVTLDAAGIGYHGIWSADTFPGRSRALYGDSWPRQLDRWRLQLEALAAELAAGDCRVFLHELDSVRGAYAPLTRICEQLRLARAEEPL